MTEGRGPGPGMTSTSDMLLHKILEEVQATGREVKELARVVHGPGKESQAYRIDRLEESHERLEAREERHHEVVQTLFAQAMETARGLGQAQAEQATASLNLLDKIHRERAALAEQGRQVEGRVGVLEKAHEEEAQERKATRRQVIGAVVSLAVPGIAALLWLGWLALQAKGG